MDEIPQLSASWMTDTLRAEGIIGPDVDVFSLTSRALDSGLMASTFLLELTYSAGGTAPPTMVGKFPSLNRDSHTAGLEIRAYEREIMFYRHLSERVNTRVPACYHADINTQTGEFSLLMEDLSSAIVATPETPNCYELTERSVKQLAKLQKATWANDEIRALPWVLDYSDKQYMQQIKSWAEHGWEIIKSVADERLSAPNQKKGDRLLEGLDVWSDMVRLRGCLAHCDFRFPNMLFSDTEAITVDWQTLHWSNPGTDIAYFLNNSLSSEQRTKWQGTLRQTYFDALMAEGVSGYSQADSDIDFRFGLIYRTLMLMVTTFGVGANHLSEPARNQILDAFSSGFWQNPIATLLIFCTHKGPQPCN